MNHSIRKVRGGAQHVRSLSVGFVGAALLVAACSDEKSLLSEPYTPPPVDGGTDSGGGLTSLSFPEGVEVPTTDADKRLVGTVKSAMLNGVSVKVDYHTVLRSRQAAGGEVFGRLVDKGGAPIKAADSSEMISPTNDFSSILPVGKKIWELTQFETVPAAMYLTELEQGSDGNFKALSTRPIDFSGVDGFWIPCAGSVSPWGTHLSSEEYPPDARSFEKATKVADLAKEIQTMLRYWNLDPATATIEQAREAFRPYNFGYATDVGVNEAGVTTVKKYYATGRHSLELAYVMPDKKTVYFGEDGENDAMYMFIADAPGDLSAGTLYAAKWEQTSPAGQPHGTAKLTWVDLGHATNDELAPRIKDTKFSDLFETAVPLTAAPWCPEGFTSVNTDSDAKLECIKLKPGMEKLASRFESRRYAAYKGATTEFRKFEGITHDPDTHTLYVAFSELARGTEDGHARDNGGPNHIRLAKNECGAVFALDLAADAALKSEYVATAASAAVEGTWRNAPGGDPYPASSPYAGNVCDVNAIASPDNLSFLPGYNLLIIGEDATVGHQNDAAWAYDTVTHKLTRIFSVPYGAETTGGYWFPNINGFGYLKMQIQHPYGETDEDKVPADSPERESYTGYIGPFPALNSK